MTTNQTIAICPVAAAEQAIHTAYLHAALFGSVAQRCEWAPLITDYSNSDLTQVQPTLGHVMANSLGFGDGPTTNDLMSILMAAARGRDVSAQALDLLSRMATQFAETSVE